MGTSAEREFDALVATATPSRSARPHFAVGSRLDDWWASCSARTRRAIRIAGPTAVLVTAAATRLTGIGHPDELVFDETYYVKDAWSLWNLGYSSTWPEGADERFEAGETEIYTERGSFVVHPPLGKWLIALGMAALGPEHSAGWRLATAIAGILMVALVMIVAKRLTGSLLLATIAGGLLAIEGNAIVMSRVGLLDGFLALFALAGFACIVMDRERGSPRLWRPWLIAAGVAFGAASAVKWSGAWFLAAFGIWTVVTDILARRRRGDEAFVTRGLLVNGPLDFLHLVPAAIATHLATWASWFATSGGYQRQWAADDANAWGGGLAWVPRSIQSWLHYMQVTYEYHVGESRPHDYESDAWMWPLLVRPTSMWYRASSAGDPGCASETCGASITGLANPLIWWAAVAAIGYLVVRVIRRREWQPAAILVAFAAGWVPWLLYPERTIFHFYTIAFEPYLILALAIAAGAALGAPLDERSRRVSGLWTVGAFLGLAVVLSAYFWPLWTGMTVDFGFLASHWWLPSWR